jgi:hypothetical protein
LSFAQGPGNVSSNLQWWFKANDGTNTVVELDQVNKWSNFGKFKVKEIVLSPATDPLFKYPMYKNQVINFNPAVLFSRYYCSSLQTVGSDTTNMQPHKASSTNFIVFQSNDTRGNPATSLHYYSPYIMGTEASGTKYDFEIGLVGGTFAMKCDSVDEWSTYSTEKVNDNICHIGVAKRKVGNTNLSPSIVDILVDGKSVASVKQVNTSFMLNAFTYPYSNYYHGFTVGGQIDYSQSVITYQTCYDGFIAEMITYDRDLTPLEVQKVNSYLAIKYGITLNQSNPYDYLRADGMVIWDGIKAGIYKHNIAGIGLDNISSLSQTKSQSINPGAALTVSNPSNLDDKEFMVWSDNGLEFTASKSTYQDLKPPVNARIERVWHVQNTGDVGYVTLEFDLTQVPGNLQFDDLRLLIDDDGMFKTGVSLIVPTSLNNRIVRFEKVDLSKYKYYTIGSLNRERTPLATDIVQNPTPLIYELITPNNDGHNDGFKIKDVDYFSENELFVYTHDGLEVFHKKNYLNGDWDVTNIPDGIYFYVFKFGNQQRSGKIVVQR